LPETVKAALPETLPIKPPTSDVPDTALPDVVLNAEPVPVIVPPVMLPTNPPTLAPVPVIAALLVYPPEPSNSPDDIKPTMPPKFETP